MDLTTAHYAQLIIALLFGIIVFSGVHALPARIVLIILIVLIPFQVIASRYGSLNMVLTYLVAAAFFLQGRMSKVPLFVPVFVLLIAYLAAFTNIPPSTVKDHALYLISFGSNLLLFIMAYNYIVRTGDIDTFRKALVIQNILVLGYCAIQLSVGFEKAALFGITEFSLQQNRDDARLVGPFNATALTSEYLVVMTMFLVYSILKDKRARTTYLFGSIAAANCLFLITTGNRGGFIMLVFAALLFLYFFRSELGGKRIVKYVIVAPLVFVLVSVVVINFTTFNRLYDRLAATEIEGAIPDTRKKAWPHVWERFQEHPVLGHGPRIRLIEEEDRRIPGHEMMGYPHSMYLFILYSLGIVGLAAYLLFFASLFMKMRGARPYVSDNPYLNGIPRLGQIVLLAVLVSEIRIEMFRYSLMDYQNFFFMFMGMVIGVADYLRFQHVSRIEKQSKEENRNTRLLNTIMHRE